MGPEGWSPPKLSDRYPIVVRGDVAQRRWADAVRAGNRSQVVDHAPAHWDLAARGALVESGWAPLAGSDPDRKDSVWSDLAPRLYAQAVANQWDPATAVDWTPPVLPPEIEAAVVQIMICLVENEHAAFVVPARFLRRIHPYYGEVVGFLATQIADEARHVEVFTGRLGLCARPPSLSVIADIARRARLVQRFVPAVCNGRRQLPVDAVIPRTPRHAPDRVTVRVTRLALTDEGRHVAFSTAHLEEHVTADPAQQDRLRAGIERRDDATTP